MLDLFSGIGGFSLGLERAGMRTVAFCEINPFCRRVLAKHWPAVPCYDDIRTLTAARLTADGIVPDVLCGGFPCQDISTAGKGAGIAGERSGLWSEYARLIGEILPRFIIVENVAALLGRGLSRVLGDLAALGFDAEWHCIPASAVGAPHRRDRIWIVAYARIVAESKPEHQTTSIPLERRARMEFGIGGRGQSFNDALSYVADSNANGNGETKPTHSPIWEFDGCREDLAYPNTLSREGMRAVGREGVATQLRSQEIGRSSESVSHTNGQRQSQPQGCLGDLRRWFGDGSWWESEPDVGQVAHGVPSRVDRLRSLGNAVVPQIPELIGRAILAAEAAGATTLRVARA